MVDVLDSWPWVSANWRTLPRFEPKVTVNIVQTTRAGRLQTQWMTAHGELKLPVRHGSTGSWTREDGNEDEYTGSAVRLGNRRRKWVL